MQSSNSLVGKRSLSAENGNYTICFEFLLLREIQYREFTFSLSLSLTFNLQASTSEGALCIWSILHITEHGIVLSSQTFEVLHAYPFSSFKQKSYF